MTSCNITIVRHEGIPLYQIIKHETQFKIHNTHAFIYTNHTIIRYFSYLKPIQMYEKVKGHLEFWIKFWIWNKL